MSILSRERQIPPMDARGTLACSQKALRARRAELANERRDSAERRPVCKMEQTPESEARSVAACASQKERHMLITLIQNLSETVPPLTIDVSEDRAEDVISAMAMEGWRVLSKIYGPAAPALDSLQIALFEESTQPPGT
jgi:hypothetical protein